MAANLTDKPRKGLMPEKKSLPNKPMQTELLLNKKERVLMLKLTNLLALLAALLLTGCQTLSPKTPKALTHECPVVNFKAGKLMPQVVRLKTEYELCKVNNNGLQAWLQE